MIDKENEERRKAKPPTNPERGETAAWIRAHPERYAELVDSGEFGVSVEIPGLGDVRVPINRTSKLAKKIAEAKERQAERLS